jgi:hypothetical protein
LCAEMSTQAAVPGAAAAAAHGTPGSLAGAAGLGFGLAEVLVGAGLDVVAGFDVGAALVVALVVAGVVAALEVVGVPPPAPAAATAPPPAFGPPGAVPPPEQAVSTNAVASAAAPARSLFTIRYPQLSIIACGHP